MMADALVIGDGSHHVSWLLLPIFHTICLNLNHHNPNVQYGIGNHEVDRSVARILLFNTGSQSRGSWLYIDLGWEDRQPSFHDGSIGILL
jgi:hypothetical protein